MTLQACYEKMGADYTDVLARLRKEERVEKILLLFLKDPSFSALEAAMQEKNWKNAFVAVHTLKGVSMNLSLKPLVECTVVLTEVLRSGSPTEDPYPLFEKLQTAYETVYKAVSAYAAERQL